MHWQDEGQEPDYRFSLANERTFLAWIRTALAVLAGGILLHQFATRMEPRWGILAVSVGMALAAALMAGGAWFRWKGNEIAMRHARPLPRSWLIPFAALFSVALAALAALLLYAS